MPRNFEANYDAKTKTLALRMFGVVGEDIFGDGTYVDATKVAAALSDYKPERIHLAVSSRGGDCFHGFAIYELLKKSGAKTKASIYGLCASVMSVIVLACDEIEMNSASLVMMHESGMSLSGRIGSTELRFIADINDKLNESQTEIFVARTGKSADEIKALLAAETWFTAKEALEAKLITSISPAKTIAAEFTAENFTNVPARILPLLADLQLQGVDPMTNPTTPPTAPATPAVPTVETPATPPVAPVQPVVTTVAPTAVATPPAAPVVPATPAVDPLLAERDRTTQINAACRMAGRPELADQYIRDAVPLATAQASLLTVVCAERMPSGGAPSGVLTADKATAQFEAEFAASAELYADMGLSKEAFVKSRRVDEGLEKLTKFKA